MINIFIKLVLFVILVSADDECLNISSPSDVRIASRDDRIVVQWSLKSECNVRYKVTVRREGEEDFILKCLTNKTFFTISRKSMSCSKIEVTVKAIGKNSKSDVVTSSYFIKPTQEDIDSALITYDSFDSTTRELRWSVDRNFSLCKTEYQLSINNQELFKTVENIYQLPEDKLNPICQNNDVKIKVIVDGISGREQQIEEKIIVAPSENDVKDINVTFEAYDSVNKLLKWTINDNPFPECIIKYIVNLNTYEFENDYNYFLLPSTKLYSACENNVVKIRPFIEGIPGREQQYDGKIIVDPTVEEVQEARVIFDDFNSQTRTLTWELNKPFTKCAVTYDITVNNHPPKKVESNFFTLPSDQLNPACEDNVVRVRPQIQNIIGRDQQFDGKIVVVPTVEEVQEAIATFDDFNSETKILSWILNKPFTECIVTYNVTVNNLPPRRVESNSINLQTIQLNPACENNVVMVKPEINAIPGSNQRLDGRIVVNPSVEEVLEAIVTFNNFNSQTRRLRWTLNRPFTECIVTYNVSVNNLPPIRVETNTFTLPTELLNPACENNIVRVKPEIQRIPGRDQQLNGKIVVDPTVAEVQEATITFSNFNSQTKMLSWELNRLFTECIVTYNITVNNLAPIRVETNNFNLPTVQLNPACQNNIVSIRPQIQFIYGREQWLDGRIIVVPTVEEVQEAIVAFDNFNSITRILSWELDKSFTECIVTYNVTVNNFPPIRVDSNSFNLQTVQLNPSCENNVVMVKPEVQGVPGRDQQLEGRIVVYPTLEEVQEAIVTFDNFNSETKILSWNLNRPFTECIVTYNVTVNNLPPRRVKTNNVNLQTVQLNPACENNVVTVKPEIHAIPGSDQQLHGRIVVDPTVEEVQEAIVTFDNFNVRTRRLTWTLNRPFTECTVTYNVIVNNHQPRRVETNTFTLSANQLNPSCENNVVRVKPEIQRIPGRDQQLDGRIVIDPYAMEVLQVIVAFDDFNPETRILSWNVSRPFSECRVTYDVNVNNFLLRRVETNSFYLPTVQLNPGCEHNVVRVRPVVSTEIQFFPGSNQYYNGEIVFDPTVEEVLDATVIFDDFNPETKILSWHLNKPFTECTVIYHVTVNNLPPIRVESNTFDLQTVQLNSVCENNVVRVRPEIQSILGREQQYDGRIVVDPTVEEVLEATVIFEEFNSETKTLSWDLNKPFTKCIVTYDVTVNNLPLIRVESNSFNLHTVQLNPACENNVFRVRPFIESISGHDQQYDGKIVVDPTLEEIQEAIVTSYDINSETRILSWNLNRPFMECTVAYYVSVNNLPPISVESNNFDLHTVQLKPACENNVFRVRPFIQGIPGRDQQLDGRIVVDPSVEEVQEAIVVLYDFNSETKLLSWILTKAFKECIVTYSVTINNLTPIRVESNSFNLGTVQLNPGCEHNVVRVRPEVQFIPGRDQQLDGRIVVYPTVEEIQEAIVTFDNFNSETRVLSWNLNRPFTECTVTYDVTVNNLSLKKIESNFFTLPADLLNPTCENNMVMVKPEIHGIPGRDQQLHGTIAVEPSSIPVVRNSLMEFWEADRSVRVSWQPPLGLAACELTYNVHLLGNHGETILQSGYDLVTREFTYTPIPAYDNCDTIQVSITAVFRNIIGTPFNYVTCITR